MSKLFGTAFGLSLLFVVMANLCDGQEKAKKDHGSMRKEHLQASRDHDRWQSDIGKWAAEHKRALAILAQLQARILEHDADLQDLAEHARLHERHIRDHEGEIDEHEKGGSAAEHANLATKHKELMDDHAKMEKEMSSHSDQHQELMQRLSELLKLVEGKQRVESRPPSEKKKL